MSHIAGLSLVVGVLSFPAVQSVSASVSTDAKVAVGAQHSVALGSNGTVWTWGSLVPGPTGVGSKDALATPTQVTLSGGRTAVDVAATYNASFTVANDGTVWGWGSLGRGLGDTSNTTDARYTTPVQVAFDSGVSIVEVSAACEGVMARASNGDVYQWGYFYGNWQMSYARPTKVAGISGATAIERGCSASFAVLSNGSAVAWGSNGGGRLGDGSTTDRPNPVSISLPNGKLFAQISTSSSHAVARATDGSVFAWGGNSNGQLASDPNSLSYQATPRAVAIGSTTAVAVSANDSSPFSTVVTAANTVLKWGGWGTSEYVPSALSLPTADLGNRILRDVTTMQGAMFFVANDNSLWAKGWWSSADLDGNCGANASDWPMWKDGVTFPARPLVRTISQGQFGPSFNEDQISIARLETGTGTVLPLDGTGNALGSVNSEMTIIATSPRSSCYTPDRLTYEFSDNNGSSWVSTGITTSTNSFAQTVVTIAYTPATSGRKRAQIRISNPDGKSVTYRLSIGVAAASGGGGSVTPSALPIVATAQGISLAIGSDKFLYAWGSATSITGQSGTVKEPVRVTPAVDTNQTFRSVAVAKRTTDSYVAAAVSEDGKLYVWGSASPDVFVGSVSAVTAPTLLAMPSGRLASSVVIGSGQVCTSSCTFVAFGVVLDENGNVYGFGGGPQDSQPGTGKFGATVVAIPSLGGSSFSSIVNGHQGGGSLSQSFFLRQSSGDLYMWSANKVCSGSCTSWAAPVATTNVTAKITPGRLNGRDYMEIGVLEITASNALQYVPINSQNGSVGTPVPLSLPGGRTAVQATPGYWSGFSVLASDGTLWNLSSAAWPAWRVNLPVEALPVSRIASRDGVYLIGAGGAMWAIDGWDSEDSGRLTGTCAETNRDYGGSLAVRTTSTGQFGPAYTQDSFRISIDSPRYIWFNHATTPRHVDQPQIPAYPMQLNVRPNASTRLYTYFNSSCTGVAGLGVQWDLDDDGTFETTGTVGAATAGTTSLTTPIANPDPDQQWDGIALADFVESYVDITSSTPGGAMNQGGGRFISVKYSSSKGTFTQKFALVVQPKKPDGRVGVTVNQGARFTDNNEVTLGLVWPEGMTTAVISNDGSFSDAQQVPVSSSIRWTLPSTGSGLLSSIVYVRFETLYVNGDGGWYNGDGEWIQQFSDDIILDLTPPEVTSVSAASNSNAQSQRISGARSMSMTSTALVSFSALDAASGVSAVQITSDPAIPGPERAYSRQYSIPVDRGTVAVRAKDNVGHWSKWTYAKVSDYVAPMPQPETPAVVPVNPPSSPSVPVTPPAASTPAAPSPAAPTQSLTGGSTVSAPTAKAVLSGSTAKVTVSVPAAQAKTCSTKVVKGKKTTTCVAAQITVSLSGGATKKVTARAGSNSISMPKAKKGQTITVKLGSKTISRIKIQ